MLELIELILAVLLVVGAPVLISWMLSADKSLADCFRDWFDESSGDL